MWEFWSVLLCLLALLYSKLIILVCYAKALQSSLSCMLTWVYCLLEMIPQWPAAFMYQDFPVEATSTSVTIRSVTSRENTSEMWIEIKALQANTLAVWVGVLWTENNIPRAEYE